MLLVIYTLAAGNGIREAGYVERFSDGVSGTAFLGESQTALEVLFRETSQLALKIGLERANNEKAPAGPVRQQRTMSRIVASLMALTALSGSILAGIDPIGCLTRTAIAFVVGLVMGGIWSAIFGTISTNVSDKGIQYVRQPSEPETESGSASDQEAEAA